MPCAPTRRTRCVRRRDGYGYRPISRVARICVARGIIAAVESSGSQRKLGAAFDPRLRIYRDPFNELVVFVISAAGAGVLVPTVITAFSAISGVRFDFVPFVLASVVLELGLIFGHLRPAMEPRERAAWALLWGFAAALLGAAFWDLTYIQIL